MILHLLGHLLRRWGYVVVEDRELSAMEDDNRRLRRAVRDLSAFGCWRLRRF